MTDKDYFAEWKAYEKEKIEYAKSLHTKATSHLDGAFSSIVSLSHLVRDILKHYPDWEEKKVKVLNALGELCRITDGCFVQLTRESE